MMTLNLLRAEWLKTSKSAVNRWMLGTVLLIVALICVAATGIGYFYPGSDLDLSVEVLPFPESVAWPMGLLSNLGRLLVVIFVANSVGSEYARDTWKVILPRHGSRSAFLMSKWVVGLIALLLLIASTVVSAVILGWLGASILGIAADSPVSGAAEHVRTWAVMILEFVFIGAVTLFAAVLTRSTIAATVVGLLSTTILAYSGPFLSLLVTGASIISPLEHLDNLRVRWAMADPVATAAQTALFNRSMSPFASVLVVLGYVALLLSGSLYLFKSRDMAGE